MRTFATTALHRLVAFAQHATERQPEAMLLVRRTENQPPLVETKTGGESLPMLPTSKVLTSAEAVRHVSLYVEPAYVNGLPRFRHVAPELVEVYTVPYPIVVRFFPSAEDLTQYQAPGPTQMSPRSPSP